MFFSLAKRSLVSRGNKIYRLLQILVLFLFFSWKDSGNEFLNRETNDVINEQRMMLE